MLLMFSSSLTAGEWMADEASALKCAREENRPVLMVFLGKGWCPWSCKIEQDVLQSPAFERELGGEVVKVEIALNQEPLNAMLKKYSVQECPLFLLLDPLGREFARVGFLPLSGKEYGAHLSSLISDFSDVCIALDEMKKAFHDQDWITLYHKSLQFSLPLFKEMIIARGIEKEKGTFFHEVKYASLIEKGKLREPEIEHFKKKVLQRDPLNQNGTHFRIAVLEFEALKKRFKSDKRKIKALAPLVHYVSQFKKKDQEHLWKAEWMIAQFLFSINAKEAALEYAEASLGTAPSAFQREISLAIQEMKKD
jgi:protein disulfide-isomerase